MAADDSLERRVKKLERESLGWWTVIYFTALMSWLMYHEIRAVPRLVEKAGTVAELCWMIDAGWLSNEDRYACVAVNAFRESSETRPTSPDSE